VEDVGAGPLPQSEREDASATIRRGRSGTTPLHSGAGNTGGPIALQGENVDGLSASVTYSYQLCGKGDEVTAYVCVGPDGTPNTAQTFRTDGTRVGVVDHVYYTNNVSSIDTGPNWTGLHRTKARIAVPWDIARTPCDGYCAAFDSWLRNATNSGAEPYVTFTYRVQKDGNYATPATVAQRAGTGRCYAVSAGTDCFAPNLTADKAAVRAFMAKWPQVRIIGAWNEPNLNGRDDPNGDSNDGTMYYALDGHLPANRADNARFPSVCPPGSSTSQNCGPAMAARYWEIVHTAFVDRGGCDATPKCITVAGEFTGTNPTNSDVNSGGFFEVYAKWLNDYLRSTGSYVPYVWAIHPYTNNSPGYTTNQATVSRADDVVDAAMSDARYLGCGGANAVSNEPRSMASPRASGSARPARAPPTVRRPPRAQPRPTRRRD
jgi:hypothetical protein